MWKTEVRVPALYPDLSSTILVSVLTIGYSLCRGLFGFELKIPARIQKMLPVKTDMNVPASKYSSDKN